MLTHSTNQVRHFYVADGTQTVVKGDDGFYIVFKNADGDSIRTDNITNIISGTSTSAFDTRYTPKILQITSKASTITVDKNYMLKISYREWLAGSVDIPYNEYADVKATSTVPSDLYKALAVQLYKNTVKQGIIDVYLYDGSAYKKIDASDTVDNLTGTYVNLSIVEARQPWALGRIAEEKVRLSADNIIADWANVEEPLVYPGSFTAWGNGREVADLEHFCIGERGDQYRFMGYPYVTPTKGMIDPNEEYDLVNIHYAYTGGNESVQKSEKDLTIAVKANITGGAAVYTDVNNLINDINTASGYNIPTL